MTKEFLDKALKDVTEETHMQLEAGVVVDPYMLILLAAEKRYYENMQNAVTKVQGNVVPIKGNDDFMPPSGAV